MLKSRPVYKNILMKKSISVLTEFLNKISKIVIHGGNEDG
jgi:hypothetical protein